MQVRITTDAKGRAHAKPLVRIPSERFYEYSAACRAAGARWDGNANVAPAGKGEKLAQLLSMAGFAVEVDGSLAAVREELAVNRAALREQALARIDRIQEVLRARGQEIARYQIEGILVLAGKDRWVLADDMGLGKTLQLCVALPERARGLVVSPHSLKFNWRRELGMWRPDLKVTVLEGLKSFRWPELGEVVVLNYDILPGDVEKIPVAGRQKPRSVAKNIPEPDCPVYLIADEAHAVKGGKTRRALLLRKLGENVRAAGGATWGSTGTMMPSGPMDLWNVLNAFDLAKDAFGSFANFTTMMGGSPGTFGIKWDANRVDPRVPELLRRVSLKRMKRDVLKDLPAKRFTQIPVAIDAETQRVCNELISFLASRGISWDDVTDIVQLTKAKGASFALFSKAMSALATAKTNAALDIIQQYEENNEPLVVVSEYRPAVDLIGSRPGWVKMTGDESVAQRQAAVDAFQAGELRGIVGTRAVIGTGWTLTRSSNMLRIDRAFNPPDNTQAEDRLCRRGQLFSVNVNDLVADHVLDARQQEILVNKGDMQDATETASAVREGEAVLEVVADEPFRIVGVDLAAGPDFTVTRQWRTTHTGAHIQIDAPSAPSVRRPAKDAAESWAGRGIRTLAGLDSDRALVINGVGFSKMDGDFGHKLAERLEKHGGLTDKEWGAAVRMATKYRRQVGEPPK